MLSAHTCLGSNGQNTDRREEVESDTFDFLSKAERPNEKIGIAVDVSDNANAASWRKELESGIVLPKWNDSAVSNQIDIPQDWVAAPGLPQPGQENGRRLGKNNMIAAASPYLENPQNLYRFARETEDFEDFGLNEDTDMFAEEEAFEEGFEDEAQDSSVEDQQLPAIARAVFCAAWRARGSRLPQFCLNIPRLGRRCLTQIVARRVCGRVTLQEETEGSLEIFARRPPPRPLPGGRLVRCIRRAPWCIGNRLPCRCPRALPWIASYIERIRLQATANEEEDQQIPAAARLIFCTAWRLRGQRLPQFCINIPRLGRRCLTQILARRLCGRLVLQDEAEDFLEELLEEEDLEEEENELEEELEIGAVEEHGPRRCRGRGARWITCRGTRCSPRPPGRCRCRRGMRGYCHRGR